jgi:hypothetical protein
MFARLLETFFGCWHTNLSFPRTAKASSRRNAAASITGTYVVCLDCGKEFAYDWLEMKVVDPLPRAKSAVVDLAAKHAA